VKLDILKTVTLALRASSSQLAPSPEPRSPPPKGDRSGAALRLRREQALDDLEGRDAPKILRGNVYGWFSPVERGVYTLAESGRAALLRWPQSAPPTAVHQ
jgi:hypothetical protein